METIYDVVREMREFADADSQSIGRDVLRRRIQHFADRIEAAVKREREATCQESLQVGNAAKMRKALKAIYECAKDGVLTIRESAFEKVLSALAEPPRNCDVYRTKKERDAAYKKYREYVVMSNDNPFFAQDEMMSKEDWLLAEAKGEKTK